MLFFLQTGESSFRGTYYVEGLSTTLHVMHHLTDQQIYSIINELGGHFLARTGTIISHIFYKSF